MKRSIAWLVFVVACAEKPKALPLPAPVASTIEASTNGGRSMTIVVERCLPVGYGEHCGGTIDGRPVSIQACVGRDAIDDLLPRLAGAPIVRQDDGGKPVTIAVEVKYVGVLDAAYSTDSCGGLLFEDSKEQFHIMRVIDR